MLSFGDLHDRIVLRFQKVRVVDGETPAEGLNYTTSVGITYGGGEIMIIDGALLSVVDFWKD